MCVVGVVCCQVEFAVPCLVYLSIIVKPGPLGLLSHQKKKKKIFYWVVGNTRHQNSKKALRWPLGGE